MRCATNPVSCAVVQDGAVVDEDQPQSHNGDNDQAGQGPITSRPVSKVQSRVGSPDKPKKQKIDPEAKLPSPVVKPTVPNVPDFVSFMDNLNAKVRGPGESMDNPDHLCRCCRNKGRMVRHMAF